VTFYPSVLRLHIAWVKVSSGKTQNQHLAALACRLSWHGVRGLTVKLLHLRVAQIKPVSAQSLIMRIPTWEKIEERGPAPA
jgi:hypothetical protein